MARDSSRMARGFLWVVAAGVLLLLAGAFAYALYGERILQAALTPSVSFAESAKAPPPAYASPRYWLARPDIEGNPTTWAPSGYRAAPRPAAAVFYVAPTAYLKRDRWNAPYDDAETNERLEGFLRTQASIFNSVGAVWAPKYRQATFGAFLSSTRDALLAFDFAYRDVRDAWSAFLASNPNRPIILVGHSQGAFHLLRLMREEVAGEPVAERIVAAYVAGWPISIEADVPAFGLDVCAGPEATRCLLSWQSFAEPADPSLIRTVFNATPGFTGRPHAGTRILCTNPLLGAPTSQPAPPAANMGALRPNFDAPQAPALVEGAVGARCEDGFLLIGADPEGFGRYELPGNNFHVYDYALFWANLRADAERRLNAFQAERAPTPG